MGEIYSPDIARVGSLHGGEGIERPQYDMIHGLFEKNKLAAKVPVNSNHYSNANPAKPAPWVEIPDTENYVQKGGVINRTLI